MTRLSEHAEREGLVVSECRICSRKILWAKTPTGKSIPLDIFHTPRGKWLVEISDGVQVGRCLTQAEKEERGGEWLRRPHMAVCKPDPQARLV